MKIAAAITRRDLFRKAAGAVCLPLFATGNQPLGLALYTLHDLLPQRPAELLKLAREIGYTEVELMRSQIAPLRPYLTAVGLQPVSMHFETPLITGNWQAWKDADMPPIDQRYTFDRALEESHAAGIKNAVFNYLPPKERGGPDYYRSLSDKLNAAAAKCRAAGLRLWYHNHNFEFAPKPGGRPIDVLLKRLDPDLISLEVDLFWVGMAGQDPAAFVRENAGRVVAVHLKDRGRGAVVPTYDIASVPNDVYQEVGRGTLNFQQIFQTTMSAKVQHYFIEQDYSADPVASIRRSYAAVRDFGL